MQFPAEIKPFYRTFPFWWYLNWNMVSMGLPDEMQDTCWGLTDAHRIGGNIKKTFIPWTYPLWMDLDGLTLATLSLWPFLLILCKKHMRIHAAKQDMRMSDAGRWVTCRNCITTNCHEGEYPSEVLQNVLWQDPSWDDGSEYWLQLTTDKESLGTWGFILQVARVVF